MEVCLEPILSNRKEFEVRHVISISSGFGNTKTPSPKALSINLKTLK